MSVGRWACGGLRAYVSRERQLTSREQRGGRAADGVEGPPRTADQDELRAAAALLHLVWSVHLSRSRSGKDTGDER